MLQLTRVSIFNATQGISEEDRQRFTNRNSKEDRHRCIVIYMNGNDKE